MKKAECPDCEAPLDGKKLPCYVCRRSDCKRCDECCNDEDQLRRPPTGKTR